MRNILIYHQPVLDCVLKNLEYTTFITLENVINLGGAFYKKEELKIFIKHYKFKNLYKSNHKLYLICENILKLPDKIGDLTKLTDICISQNNLIYLPDSIGNLTNLIKLNVSYNKLTHLPDSIGNLTNLQKLFVDNNKLTRLPDTLSNLINLTDLYIYDNKISVLPVSITNLANLNYCSFDVNVIVLADNLRQGIIDVILENGRLLINS